MHVFYLGPLIGFSSKIIYCSITLKGSTFWTKNRSLNFFYGQQHLADAQLLRKYHRTWYNWLDTFLWLRIFYQMPSQQLTFRPNKKKITLYSINLLIKVSVWTLLINHNSYAGGWTTSRQPGGGLAPCTLRLWQHPLGCTVRSGQHWCVAKVKTREKPQQP